jgi:exosortase
MIMSLFAILFCAIAWCCWPGILAMVDRWENDPRYSHGFLVPLFSLVLLWLRREWMPERWVGSIWGIGLLLLGAALLVAGGYLRVLSAEGLALLPLLAGVVLLVGGMPALRWSWPSIVFLVFMVPWPYRFETALAGPLQSIATKISTYALQTFGFMAFAEGNVIQLGQSRIGVVDACSGLSMIMTFVALSTAAAIVIRTPLVFKVLLVLSSIPVALLANLIRITVTGMLHSLVGSEMANHFYHDLAGWLMIPLALVLYWLELKLLGLILAFESEAEVKPLAVGLSASVVESGSRQGREPKRARVER